MRWCNYANGKGSFYKLNMSRIVKLLVFRVKANEGALISGVSEKNTRVRPRCKLVGSVRFKPWEAKASKGAKL